MTASLPPYDSPQPGSAREAAGLPEPATQRGLPHIGGPENPSVTELRARFPKGVLRSQVMWGETTLFVALESVHAIITHLRDETAHAYNYLVDITAVEYRDADQPMEVVWHLRSLPWQRFLRLKVELNADRELEVPSITDLYAAADWLERECYDMFGITFSGHPDLRRILMWDTYREGHPLRKDFPLRGRFSRSEQLSQALAIDTSVGYTTSEISIAEAFADLPVEMQQRLRVARDAALRETSGPDAAESDAAKRDATAPHASDEAT